MEKVIPLLEKVVKYGGTIAIVVAAAKFILDHLTTGTPSVAPVISVANATDIK